MLNRTTIFQNRKATQVYQIYLTVHSMIVITPNYDICYTNTVTYLHILTLTKENVLSYTIGTQSNLPIKQRPYLTSPDKREEIDIQAFYLWIYNCSWKNVYWTTLDMNPYLRQHTSTIFMKELSINYGVTCHYQLLTTTTTTTTLLQK